MVALLQRVKKSAVVVESKKVASIERGLNILLGVVRDDTEKDIEKLAAKAANLRIFSDDRGKLSLSAAELGLPALVVSQFTLAARIKNGRRPDFGYAMNPERAEILYEEFCKELSKYIEVQKGVFGAYMEVEIVGDGPVTLILDSKSF